jgi:pimeloyl-ACP methyl ester carboxylesterase/predicted glycosyltransferase
MSTTALDNWVPRASGEQTRARLPDREGHVERDGVRIFFEVFGEGEPTLLLLCPWAVVPSRSWKAQIHYLARHFRVVVFDGRGSGRSDRPRGEGSYSIEDHVRDALAVMDETGTERAVVVANSRGSQNALSLAADHPDRILGAAFIGPFIPLTFWPPLETALRTYDESRRWRRILTVLGRAIIDTPRFLKTRDGRYFMRNTSFLAGSDNWNRHSWLSNQRDYVEWNARTLNFQEPHSTKAIEDVIGWGMETDGQTLIDSWTGDHIRGYADHERALELCRRVRCPVLVLQGDRDLATPHQWGEALAEATGGKLVTLEGSGHGPSGRHPVPVNLALRDFAERCAPGPRETPREKEAAMPSLDQETATVMPASKSPPAKAPAPIRGGADPTAHRQDGRKRALYISSPIGLGHAQRDVAIARELRELVPGLEIDWLAQDPVTKVLEAEGERIHPASEHLANESDHLESESAEHDLHCFQAFRRMDEILIANFMLFHDVVREERYDLWIGDEAWELDYYLHENPGEKRANYAWLSDFVGFLPMEDGGEYEAFLTADFNAQRVEHQEGLPEVRDRSIFVGNPDDCVDVRLGPDLPMVREFAERHYDFAGYVTGFDPAQFADRDALRSELGYGPDEKVCIVTVGGSGVGESLLKRVMSSFHEAKSRVPELRMIVVAGPRIDPDSLPNADGLEVRPYVHNLYRHLAACDLAVEQGGLTTSMELTANRRPFIYFPLKHHFEQNIHVHHRLQRYGAGRRMDYDDSPPDAIAEAIAEEVGREVDYREVETDGARRAAEKLAEML